MEAGKEINCLVCSCVPFSLEVCWRRVCQILNIPFRLLIQFLSPSVGLTVAINLTTLTRILPVGILPCSSIEF